METTKKGNIKIEINPERRYQGQFVGHEYYRLADVRAAFPNIDNFAGLKENSFDLNIGMSVNNIDMIRHHVQPYRKIGYIVE